MLENLVEDPRCDYYPEPTFKDKNQLEDFLLKYNDGKRIYINRLSTYPIETYKPNMIYLNQLFFKDIGLHKSLSPLEI